MRVKDDSVSISRLQPAMFWALAVAQEAYQQDGLELVVTSGDERATRHMATSLHYAGAAIDLRIYSHADMQLLAAEIDERLGLDFDVVLEADHLHIELQPRGR